ncbi:Tyrosine-protein kinase PR2 [Eumeta japonica]|uniref:Tyrosine-protein kinase PR2 n=1 Tax=Eumeta variegata TaxID=151549 RepID=A0A4C2A4E1_EUMVA|nr:Tyrosine-protein kinase PR2 [Eumeta japonica]
MDMESWPTTSMAEEEHEYQEISEKYDGDPTNNLTEEMGSMFKSLDIAGRKRVLKAQTLGKIEKKRTLNTSTMKPMSAHDQKTLDTAVALANELTARSMTDLEVSDHKQANSPSERPKFHFKFPLGLGSLGHSHETQKYVSTSEGVFVVFAYTYRLKKVRKSNK